ncbi:hypothetical protein C343_06155 [Cryptococcus neoformans C23]|uniref:Uncharacterized protein n=1 Tax=Cryptococcus neoformans Tu259-1 TaxID=1230072 RepID=A0A854QFI3_CRYNE|nr:hypothetical protein C362_05319 [Cryptococcus neoformans var. grubii Bt1]OWZ30135.1 hypothetical protein C353_06176 [Cryptococcus neoformans var. grubii AD1-83a]OWZ39533.1 hypothetical protein C343_06155 [Cryptococcus neoformans var. grubii C23]OWZ56116.1 hypothetical protein C368_01740 [Cryptococcus neoformans var. grubii 125.91]OXC81718.1 hypothetical protein C344_06055 [Cryptococcus neoformans var. grubii AD1-7a]OXG13576.1 hypothetical protein C367_06122 [Cryptococcus neoformans var. gru
MIMVGKEGNQQQLPM